MLLVDRGDRHHDVGRQARRSAFYQCDADLPESGEIDFEPLITLVPTFGIQKLVIELITPSRHQLVLGLI